MTLDLLEFREVLFDQASFVVFLVFDGEDLASLKPSRSGEFFAPTKKYRNATHMAKQ